MKKAFTLIEMVIVIVLLGILAAVIVPSQTQYIQAAQQSAAEQVRTNFNKNFVSIRTLSNLDRDQTYTNDFRFDGGYRVEFSPSNLIIRVGGTVGAADGADWTGNVTAQGCEDIFELFANVADGEINQTAGNTTWTASAATTVCTYTFNSTTPALSFTFDKADNSVSDLT